MSLLSKALKPLVFIACSIPFAYFLWGLVQNDLGANPVETVTHVTGEWALRLLLITLLMTPLRKLLGKPWPIRIRRMLGLFVFFYASLHFLTWVWIDQGLVWDEIIKDIVKRPYVTVGFLAWLLLIPLAVTSNRWSIKRLGVNWSRLHKAIYVIAVLGVLHYLWLVKADLLEPLIYVVIVTVLLLSRLPKKSPVVST